MKKKLFIGALLIVLFVTITGCGKDKNTNKTKTIREEDKKIVLKDDSFGTTTMTYAKDKDYEIKEEHTGKYTQLTITSQKENFELQLYHFDTTSANFGTGKANRSNSNGFMEYTWNSLKGYTYNGDKFSISFNVLLKDNSNSSKALFGQMSYIDNNTANIEETFRSEGFQKILNSITFEEK
ncbi:MAG: hypothetical protein IK997_01150 [Bacilli bacterium]|nr:hypothetical protein [Bacilli bacterium]